MALHRLPDGHEKENTMVRKYWVLLLLLLVIFSVRLSFFAINEGNYYWDEAVYLHLAKNIHEGAYASELGEQYRAPLFPFLLSFFEEEYAHIFIFLMVIASALAVFLLGKEVFNTKIGLVAATLFSAMPLYFFFSFKLLTEPLAIFLEVMAFFFLFRYERGEKPASLYAMTIFLGLSVLTRYPAIILPAVLYLYLLFTRWQRKELYISGALFVLMLSPIFVLGMISYGHPLGMLMTNFADNTTPNGTVLFYFLHFFSMLGFFVPLCFIFGLSSRYKKTAIFLFMGASVVLLSLLSQRTERFFLLLFPFFAIVAAKGIARLDRWNIGTPLLALWVIASIFTGVSLIEEDAGNTRFLINTAQNFSFDGIVMSNSPVYFSYFGDMTVVNFPKTMENVENVSYFIVDTYHPRYDGNYSSYVRYLNENKDVVVNLSWRHREIVVYA